MVGLWSLAPRSTIVQLYHGSQFVLLVGETRVSAQNNQPVASYWQSLLHMLYLVHLVWAKFELTTSVVIDTDCIGIIVNPKTIRTWSQWPFYIRDNLCSTNWIMYVIFLLPMIPLEAEIKIKIIFICLI